MQITNNFHLIEFHSKDGSPMPDHVLQNVAELARNLQILRNEIGKPIHINSGYRSPEHNRRIGGVPNSFHTKGMAADIVVRGISPRKLSKIIRKLISQGKMEKGGIGLYNTFVHYDIRGYNARWDNSSWFNF
jgi:uncharacterized protein YcbK (DUF882 family)